MTKIIKIDFETSGLSPVFDQPTSVCASVYKDEILIDSISLKCRCESTRLVSPIAMFVNQSTFNDLTSEMPLREMMFSLYNFIEGHQPAVLMAHNSRFDFNFSFNANFQNLITPDWYHWKHPNRIVDSLEIIRSIYVFNTRLKFMRIPLTDFATPNFQLERLVKENDIRTNSHTAEGDVLALHELSLLMEEESPEIYEQAFKCSSKRDAKIAMTQEPFFCTTTGTGMELQGRILKPVSFNTANTEVICVDLSLADTALISSISSWEIFNRLQKDQIDNWLIKIPLNKSKLIFGIERFKYCCNPSKLSLKELISRANKINDKKHFVDACSGSFLYFAGLYNNRHSDCLENTIFNDFCSIEESAFINQFNEISWSDKWDFIEGQSDVTSDNRMARLAKKTILEFDPRYAPQEKNEKFTRFCNKRLFGCSDSSNKPWRTIDKVLLELNQLKQQHPCEEKRLNEIDSYFDWRLTHSYMDF